MEKYVIWPLFLLACSAWGGILGSGVCRLPLKMVPCGDNTRRYFFNFTSGFCEGFNGCAGNENNFADSRECIDECEDPCRIPFDLGQCDNGAEQRYRYSTDTGRCERTGYHSCIGSWDTFIRLNECKKRCEDVCSQPLDLGNSICHYRHRRFYYNGQLNRCLPFVFSGCLGNGNRFHSEAGCSRRCSRKPADTACHVAQDEGDTVPPTTP
ncbi:kunitz-type serine protease inhibitor bitisilin-3-like isoform X2 [Haemaphysalis longicornis]